MKKILALGLAFNNFNLRGVTRLTLAPLLVVLVHASALGAEDERLAQRSSSPAVDEAITRTVQENLVLDNRVSSNQIDVQTGEGIVTVSGTVDNLLIKEVVMDIARSVAGVRNVQDDVELRASRLNDEQIRARVLMELAGDPKADAFDMQVQVNQGVVTLTGTADGWPQRHWAEQIAKGVPGVRGIENGLSVQASASRSPREIAAQIERRIGADDQLDKPRVQVRAQNGRVTLRGVVEDISAKNRVVRDAWVAGVQDVDATGLKIARRSVSPGRPFADVQAPADSESPSDRSREGQSGLSDQQITEAVSEALRRDRSIPARQIQVETRDGTVDLSGRVSTLLQRDRAVDLANAVRSVAGVENWIEVDAPDRSDRQLQLELEQTVREDPAIESSEIRVDVGDGAVTLRGAVQSWQEWQAAETAARGIRGVRQVKNELAVWPASTRPDTQIIADIRNRLRHDARLADNDVKVEVRDGHVTLSGSVGSQLEKAMAIAGAEVMNVRSINAGDLHVIPSRAARQWSDEAGPPPDSEIRQGIVRLIRNHPLVSPSNISVQVQDRVVTMTGTVDDARAKWEAGREAMRVAGVDKVQNFIRVKPQALSQSQDGELEHVVQQTLNQDPYVDGDDISVRVRDGQVTLQGEVDSTFERLEAAAAVRQVQGVAEVRNDLRVIRDTEGYTTWPFQDLNPGDDTAEYQPSSTMSDSELQSSIRKSLASHPLLQDNDVQVRVEDGLATLTGTVDSREEWSDAGQLVRDVGAPRVQNRLEVNP